jgi:hypothetical protein
MTLRERNFLLFVVLAIVGVGGVVFVFHQWIWQPLQEAQRKIDDLQDEVDQKDQQIRFVLQEKKRLEKYKLLSLPANPEQASSDYSTYLKDVLRSSKLSVDKLLGPPTASFKPGAAGKKAGHLTLPFVVTARGSVDGVIELLERLKAAPIAHRVKAIAVQPAEAGSKDAGKLNVNMTIEALIVNKSDSMNPFVVTTPDTRLLMLDSLAALRRAPVGLAMMPWGVSMVTTHALVPSEDQWTRDYADIAKRNLFVGGVASFPKRNSPDAEGIADLRPYVRLVQTDALTQEAFLRNILFSGKDIRLRPKKYSGFDTFRIKNEDKSRDVVTGKVMRVDQREVFFQVAESVYRIHIGQSLAEAMRRAISDDEMDYLELTSLYDAEFARKAMETKGSTKAPSKFNKNKKKM